VSPALAEEDDDREPLDFDPSVAYRFGALSDLTGGLHLSGLKLETYPARAKRYRAGPFGFHLKSAQFRSNSVRFVLFKFLARLNYFK
jgi:hypothetical protein